MTKMAEPTRRASGSAKTMPPATFRSSARQVKCGGQVRSLPQTQPDSRTIPQAFLFNHEQEAETKRAQGSFSIAACDILRWLDLQGGKTSHTTSGGHQDDTARHPMLKAKVAVPAAPRVTVLGLVDHPFNNRCVLVQGAAMVARRRHHGTLSGCKVELTTGAPKAPALNLRIGG